MTDENKITIVDTLLEALEPAVTLEAKAAELQEKAIKAKSATVAQFVEMVFDELSRSVSIPASAVSNESTSIKIPQGN